MNRPEKAVVSADSDFGASGRLIRKILLFSTILAGCLTEPDKKPFQQTWPPDLLSAPCGKWISLFDEKTLTGWTPVEGWGYGEVHVEDGVILLEKGSPMTAVAWGGGFPRSNYEVEVEASRLDGDDFFCGMTFPVGDTNCTLIVGGFGGEIFGLSNIDGMNASENATTRLIRFDDERWYHVRLLVTDQAVEVWFNGEPLISQEREGYAFSIWDTQKVLLPFGVSSWNTRASLLNFKFRLVE